MGSRVTRIVVAVIAVLGLVGAALWSRESSPPTVTEQRLTAEVFGDPALSSCVAGEFARTGRPLERLAPLLGGEAAGTLSLDEQERIDALIRTCVSPPAAESETLVPQPADDDGALPEQPVVEVRIDPEMPLAATNLD